MEKILVFQKIKLKIIQSVKIYKISMVLYAITKHQIDADIEKREIYGQLDNYKFTFDLVTRDIKSIQNLETGEFVKTYN